MFTTREVQNMTTHLDFDRLEKRERTVSRIRNTIVYAFLILWALVVLFPFYWMLLTSVKGYGAYNSEYIPQLFTLSPTLENYLEAFTAVPLADYFLNTLVFTLITTALMMIVTVLAAFAFARLNFRGKNGNSVLLRVTRVYARERKDENNTVVWTRHFPLPSQATRSQ